MDHPLIVLGTDENGESLLREAASLAAGAGATLEVLSLISADEFGEKRAQLDAAGREEHTTYDERAVLDNVSQNAEETVKDALEGIDADWDVVAGLVGDAESEADRILETAERNDADHLFVTGRKRSPTGKAVFGDRAQAVILNFDGPVTTLLG